ncbi:UDP-N-acetylglucosamine 1-carboxyvinyltransferase [Ammoniphilus sp. CFH 90114]|uniref:UDP-N-acetylglucosamine 1-carboxyvinyltransferase n=1 Tax=Ammoniphilus sp. CFH 90114 TaxID=2493665 RepID=UPI00100DD03B|nr:UDP-N-acetylglucosamine 1-carboxyvinyltransferase [Ammoniphilus sp. CFH 90114]RXT15008.1 UDP-N-acetylglucosamine 1-carboxyvinyltransferase [Ammoniphilus sp. CFH 90114]
MEKFAVQGGRPLSGCLRIQGSKNAALPILAATVLAGGQYSIQDVPHLTDISVMLEILTTLGAKSNHEQSVLTLDTSSLFSSHIPVDLMGQMRSSIFLMGPMLARFGEVTIYPPGGCAIGERKIDLHIQGLKALGANFTYFEDHIHCSAKELIGADIGLSFPSVGATENIMMAATLAKGKTIIRNAAKEPEIIDLQNFLNRMGAKVCGAGTAVIEIEGVERLEAVSYKVIPDRIVAGTMLLAACMTGGRLTLENIVNEHLTGLIDIVKQCGVEIEYAHDIIIVSNNVPIQPVSVVTGPYPEFPTDMQAQLMAFLALSKGTSVIRETVFDGRFKHVEALKKMGAQINIMGKEAHIQGGTAFKGAEVNATDLRGGAALVLAGLAASGTTFVNQVHHIDRGYERIERQLQSIGASIKRIQT